MYRVTLLIYRRVFTARIRRMWAGNVFSLFTSGGGVSPARGGGGVSPARGQGGGSVQLGGSVQWGGSVQPGGWVRPAGGGDQSNGGGSAKIGLTTRRAVCLLCSRRRTLLFPNILEKYCFMRGEIEPIRGEQLRQVNLKRTLENLKNCHIICLLCPLTERNDDDCIELFPWTERLRHSLKKHWVSKMQSNFYKF